MLISDFTTVSYYEANSPEESVVQEVPIPEKPVNQTSKSLEGIGLVYLTSGFLAIVSIIVFLKHLQVRKVVRGQFYLSQPFHKIPCTNCQYFNNNLYMKCAVQPSIVLSENAKDCTDYQPLDESQ